MMSETPYPNLGELLGDALKSIKLSQSAFGRALPITDNEGNTGVAPQTISSWKKRGFIPYSALQGVLAFFDEFDDDDVAIARLKHQLNVMKGDMIGRKEMGYGSGTFGEGTYGGGAKGNDAEIIENVMHSHGAGKTIIHKRIERDEKGRHIRVHIKDGVDVVDKSDIELSEGAIEAIRQGRSKTAVIALEARNHGINDRLDDVIIERYKRETHNLTWEHRNSSIKQIKMLLDESLPHEAGTRSLDFAGDQYTFDYVDDKYIIDTQMMEPESAGRSHAFKRRMLEHRQLYLAMAKRLHPGKECILIISFQDKWWDEYGAERKSERDDCMRAIPESLAGQLKLMDIGLDTALGPIETAKLIAKITGNPAPRSLEVFESDEQDDWEAFEAP